MSHKMKRRDIVVIIGVLTFTACIVVTVVIPVVERSRQRRFLERFEQTIDILPWRYTAQEADEVYKSLKRERPDRYDRLPGDVRARLLRRLSNLHYWEGRYARALEYEVEKQRLIHSDTPTVDCAMAAYLAALAEDTEYLHVLKRDCSWPCVQQYIRGCIAWSTAEYSVALDELRSILHCREAPATVTVLGAFMALRCVGQVGEYEVAHEFFPALDIVGDMIEETSWGKEIIAYEAVEVATLCEAAGWHEAAAKWAHLVDGYLSSRMARKADAHKRAEVNEVLERVTGN